MKTLHFAKVFLLTVSCMGIAVFAAAQNCSRYVSIFSDAQLAGADWKYKHCCADSYKNEGNPYYTNLPAYNNKLMYIDPDIPAGTPSYYFPTWNPTMGNDCTGGNVCISTTSPGRVFTGGSFRKANDVRVVYKYDNPYYSQGNAAQQPKGVENGSSVISGTDITSFWFSPYNNGVGNKIIWLVDLWNEDWGRNHSAHEYHFAYSSFTITVERGPSWKTNVPFTNVCANDNTQYNLASYVDNASGVTFTVDNNSTPVTYYQPSAYAPGVQHTITLHKTYANGAYAKNLVVTTLQAAPVVNTGMIIRKNSCGDVNGLVKNGRITIPAGAITTSPAGSNIRWILKKGTNASQPCKIDFLQPSSSDCGVIEQWSQGNVPSTSAIVINNLPADSYSLWIVNAGETSGNCYQAIPETIGLYPDLQIAVDNNPAQTHTISCYNAGDGQIRVSAAGGDLDAADNGSYLFSLTKNGVPVNASIVAQDAGSITWGGLAAGDYVATVDNACQPSKSVPVTLADIVPVSGSASVQDPTCTAPANGSITANATGGAGNFIYTLYNNDNNTQLAQVTAAQPQYVFNGLPAGNYRVVITDALHPACTGYSTVKSLAPVVALTPQLIQQTNASCAGYNDASLSFSATGGTLSYRYTLTGGSYNTTNTTGAFTGLSKGDYQLVLKNSNGTCTDQQTVVYTISEPQPLAVTLQATNVTCNGDGDGVVSSTAGGGSGNYSYTWQAYQGSSWQTDNFNSGTDYSSLAPGRYRLVLGDRNSNAACIVVSEEKIITQPAILNISQVVISEAVCLADGAPVALTVTGGNGGNQFFYNNGAGHTAIAAGEALHQSGDYIFKVVDQKGCAYEQPRSYTVTLPDAALSFSSTATNVSCNGLSDGALIVTPTGGNGGIFTGYQFKISGTGYNKPYAAITGYSQLPAGSYVVTVKDGRGCEVPQTIAITQPQTLQFASVNVNIACYGNATGTITPAVTGGTLPYAISRDGTAVNNNQAITQLPAGDYVFHVKDSHGCTVDKTVTLVNSYAALKETGISVYDIHCRNTHGHVAIQASGGDGNYHYEWSTDNWNTAHNYLLTDSLTAGNYAFRITDGQGCVTPVQESVSITEPGTALAYSETISNYNGVNIACYGGATGWIEVNATGGNGAPYNNNYMYALNSGAYGTTARFEGLTAGNYTVYVKDDRGCIVQKPFTLVQSAALLNLGYTQQHIQCFGEHTGSIAATAAGGTAPYQFNLSGAGWGNNGSFAQLAAGTYQLQLKDANGCTAANDVTLVNSFPKLEIASVQFSDIVCFNDKATIAPAVTGGDGQYHYWYAADGGSYREQTITNQFTSAVYQLQVRDGQGCVADAGRRFEVTAPVQALDFAYVLSDYNGVNISCYGGSNGFATLTPSGGNGADYTGYTYALDNDAYAAANLVEHINTGAHTLHVRDARGCTVAKQVTLTQSSLRLTISVVRIQNVKCGNDQNGRIEVMGQGGSGQLRYSLNGAPAQGSPVFDNLAAGDYVVSVLDVNNCNNDIAVSVKSAYPAIAVNGLQAKDIVCFGDKGQINLSASGGNQQYSFEYALQGGNYQPFPQDARFDAGSYTVRVKDGAGCYSAESNVLTITSPPAALDAATASTDYHGVNISCYGLQDGGIAVSAFGGNGGSYSGYQYALNNGTYQAEAAFAGLGEGNYIVYVKDARGCTIQQQVQLRQPQQPLVLQLLNQTDVVCADSLTGVLQAGPAGGVQPYRFALGSDWQNSNSFSGLHSGVYTIRVQDVNGCVAALQATVKDLYDPVAAAVTNKAVSCYGLSDGALLATVSGGDGTYTYSWQNKPAASSQLLNIPAGTYGLTVTDGHHCSRSYQYEITQPKALGMKVSAQPICEDTYAGIINAVATDGTLPYQFSLDKNTWASTPVFAGLPTGNYSVTVKDANGCVVTNDIAIVKNNIKPDINFLVASRQNARDTLVLKEISSPAPDSVTWAFDPLAIVVGNNPDSPRIRFAQDGQYWAAMTGYFSGCAYTLKKTIFVNPYDANAGPSYIVPVSIIDTAGLYPNPNNGQFRFHVKLNRKQSVIACVISSTGTWMARQSYDRTDLIDDNMSLGTIPSGTYIFRIITENESRDIMFLVGR
ncbi:hypothetical protein [Deminuibacter soli]|uniref:T9SS C-terminal target domain-containing protein n=1 Tax=Deminuibacter soli TaxID=2291815 RepID=A0A3E1NDD4_9BACT|nr:hypothetical protein [Deminuibacter soli]RFM25851.1 hypothetical protein DXN05_23105 [Deminuibacter soli]